MKSGSRWCSKALFRVCLVLGLFWFLRAGVSGREATTLNARDFEGGSRDKHLETAGRRLLVLGNIPHKTLEINFVSKRRVPNGPDPIHNRKAGNSHRPPGRA